MARRIVCITVILILIIIGLTLLVVTAPVAALTSAPATVQIVVTGQHISGQSVYDVSAANLGTIIAPNIILTHNHYGLALGRRPSDTLVIADQAGHSWQWRAMDAQLVVISAGTAVIWLPSDLSLPTAHLADSADLQQLAVNAWLTVNYWDGAARRLARREFQIIQIKDGIARLADPDLVIDSGDSGGGAYFNGNLIGNIWSINLDSAHHPIGSFNVALLPARARGFVK